MTTYFIKGKGWRYDFILEKQRYTDQWYQTKKEAKKAEAKRREEILNPEIIPIMTEEEIQTDITFLELINLRLDHVKAYNSKMHYDEHVYKARKWVKLWGNLNCNEISQKMIEKFIFERRKVSAQTANKEIRLLKALFNYGKKND
jgi:hypothetical protein